MRAEPMPNLLSHYALQPDADLPMACCQGQLLSRADFCKQVAGLAAVLRQQPQSGYALFYEQAYPFAVMLFALWHSDKSVAIAANNCQASAENLRQQGYCLVGDWPLGLALTLPDAGGAMALSALDAQHSQLTLYTSGSSGPAQAITKTLAQLQAEVDALERQWGAGLADAQVLATVSHQHIYGLLFKVLWPLAYQRIFHSAIYLSPEALLKAAAGRPSYWVASPAQLKRLDELSPWAEMKPLKAIFSSGGVLAPELAQHIDKQGSQQVIDIYGSSETGGIAWRKPACDEYWQPFPGVRIELDAHQQLVLHSPYLPDAEPYVLQDQLALQQDGRFSVLGRQDRIVKIEEKRLSLDELERALQQSELVDNAHCRIWQDKRERVAAVVSLSAQGIGLIKALGRGELVKQLKSQLLRRFEKVVLPKKWLFVTALPVSAQGKVDLALINGLWAFDSRKFPQLQYLNQGDDGVELCLRVQADLRYFNGHFPEYPILPGVAQLAWVQSYGKLFFPIIQPFTRMEAVKFKKIIHPGDTLTLKLNWNADSGKLYFDYSSSADAHSSGRLLYGAAA
ncbi:MAG: AMP-binding protein [Methylococcaceae bacterium]|nr:AMP-binding protein [Methylococcaceae bacterium]